MGKLKAPWVITDIPKDIKVELWRAMINNYTYIDWQKAVGKIDYEALSLKDEQELNKYIKTSYETYKRLKKEIKLMPKQEVDTLPQNLKIWIYSIRQNLKLEKSAEQQLKERTLDPRLKKHLDELAETTNILAHQAQRLFHYKDNDYIEVTGDVLTHISFWKKSNMTIVAEGSDPAAVFRYEKEHPVEPYMARCLYAHYEDRFGELPFKGWNQLSTGNVTEEILDNLKLLAHGGLKPCSNCPICMEILE